MESESPRLCNHCFKSAKYGHESYLQTIFPATQRSGMNYLGTVAFISQLKMGHQVILPALVSVLSKFPFQRLFRRWTPFYLFLLLLLCQGPTQVSLWTSLSQSLLSWSPSLTWLLLSPLSAHIIHELFISVFSQNCVPYDPEAFVLAVVRQKVCYLSSHTVVVQPRDKGANTIRVYYWVII